MTINELCLNSVGEKYQMKLYLGFPTAHQRPHEGNVTAGRDIAIGGSRLRGRGLGAGGRFSRQTGLVNCQICGLQGREGSASLTGHLNKAPISGISTSTTCSVVNGVFDCKRLKGCKGYCTLNP